MLTKLPDSLSRKAVISTFDRISAVAWEKLFEREDHNGLGKLRVPGDYAGKSYYSTEGVIHWLIRNDHYTIEQIESKTNGTGRAPLLPSRTHLLAG